ncbi:MAG: hypothetical protein Q7U04_14295 [Bacteriovorax sp.]|nr:hypothetical protein [Bacteriovorax sp.]
MAKHYVPNDVLQYVGKTGFITFELWQKYFLKAKCRRSKFHNWKELIRRKYLVAHNNDKIKDTLVLNRSDRNVLQLFETRPAYMPNPNQLKHDEILLNGIMYLDRALHICQWQTEAELKMLRLNDYKVETQGQLIKYPDAIIHLKNANRFDVIAVEYERTQKSRKRYGQILNAYAGMKRIDAVIWIVKTPAIKNIIIEQVKQVYYPQRERPIAFLMEETWKLNPKKLVELSNEILTNSG